MSSRPRSRSRSRSPLRSSLPANRVNERSPLLEASNPFERAEEGGRGIIHQPSRDSLLSARSFIDHEAQRSRSSRGANESAGQNLSPSGSQIPTTGDEEDERPSWRRNDFVNRNLGLLLLLLAQLNYSTMGFAYQILARITAHTAHPVTPLQVIFARMSLTWIGCVIALRVTNTPHPMLGPPEVRRLLVARGIVGFFGLSGFYGSLKYLSLSDATGESPLETHNKTRSSPNPFLPVSPAVITFLSPILTGLLCSIFLHEAFTRKEVLAAFASLTGVLLIARPKSLFGHGTHDGPVGQPVGEESFSTLKNHATESQRIFAVAIALMGTLGSAGAYTLIRTIGTRASALHSVSYFALYSTLTSWVLATLNGETWVMPSERRAEFFLWLSLCGVLGFIAQWLAAMGLQREKGGRATVTVYTQALWSTFYQVIFLKEGVSAARA